MFYEYDYKSIENKNPKLTKKCVWATIVDDGIIKNKGESFTCAYEFIAPDISSASRSKIDFISTMFNNSLVQLGENWTIQIELQRRMNNNYPTSKKWDSITGLILDRQREINFSYAKAHYHNRYFLIFTKKSENLIDKKTKQLFFKNNSSKTNKLEEDVLNELQEIKDFKTKTDNVVSILRTVMNIDFLDSERLLTLLHSQVSMNWHKMVIPDDGKLIIDRVITEENLQNSIPMKLGNYYIPIVSIKAFPSQTYSAMMDQMNKADCEFRWSTRFMCYSHEDTMHRLNNAEKRFHAKLQSMGQYIMGAFTHVESTRINQTAAAQENEVAQAKIEVTMGNIGFGDYTSEIQVWDEDIDRAKEKAQYIANIATATGFSTVHETLNSLSAWTSMQAGNIFANQRELFVSTSNVSHAVPFSSIWAGMINNNFMQEISGEGLPHVVCDTEFGIPFFLNLNVGDVGHTWISGKTGAGKSTLLATLEAQWLKYPKSQIIIFDKDRSARNLTICAGGTYIEPGKDKVTFQPLAEIETVEGKNWACEFIELLLAEQRVDVTAKMRTAIYETMSLLSTKDIESRTLTTFQQYCDYQNPLTHVNDIAEGIAPYVIGGQYGEIFDSTSNNIELTNWTMFEMGTLMNMGSSAVTPALDYLFMQCEKKFDGRPTLLILDEAWIFFKNQIFAKKIVEWLKVLRKKHVFVVFATQELEDAVNSEIASTLISQCPSKIFLADEDAMNELSCEAYKKFGLEKSEIKLLTRLIKKRDYFYKSSLGTRQFSLALDKLQLGILTNSIKDHELLDLIEKEHGKNTGKELVEYVLKIKNIDYLDLIPEIKE